MQPIIVVPANDIETQGIELSAELPVAWLEHQLEESGASARAAGLFKGRLSRSGKADVVVRGRVTASIELPCARCLGPTLHEVAAELALLLKPGRPAPRPSEPGNGKAGAGKKADGAKPADNAKAAAKAKRHAEYEFSADEADEDEYDGERVVLDGFVREAILLELPSFPLCSESCAGLEEGAAQLDRAPARAGQPSPFDALRHLLDENHADQPAVGKSLRSDEAGGNSARPSAAEVRRMSRARQRDKPKIRSSMTGRSKKS